MGDVIKLEQDVIDGTEASQILNTKTFRQMETFVHDWTVAKVAEHAQSTDELQQVAYLLVAHNQYREWIETIRDTGKMASFELSSDREAS